MKSTMELKAARWLSPQLEEMVDSMQEADDWLGSEDIPDSQIMKNLGQGALDELRMRISAYSNALQAQNSRCFQKALGSPKAACFGSKPTGSSHLC